MLGLPRRAVAGGRDPGRGRGERARSAARRTAREQLPAAGAAERRGGTRGEGAAGRNRGEAQARRRGAP